MNRAFKKSFFVVTFLLSSACIFAQNSSSLSLESLCSMLSQHPNTTGDFVQTKTISSNGRKLKSSGTFIISTSGIMWKTEKPFPSSLILTQDSMIQISAGGEKSVMSGKDNQIFTNISQTLSSVFSGNVADLKKNFECDFSSSADGTSWNLMLTPKDSTIASVMNSLELAGCVQGGAAALEYLEMSEASSNSIRYEFLNQKYPKELSADEKQNFVSE